VALPGLDLIAATDVAENLRLHLRDEPCVSYDVEIRITASIGVHEVDTHGVRCGVDSALQQADEALYRAKADGRDCVRTSAQVTA
jgi:diguanylate cyclase (GGDEF)-like protein